MADVEPGFWERRRRRRSQEWKSYRDRLDREVSGNESLSDRDLIAAAPARTSLSHPYHEMEMQRRLKSAVEALTCEVIASRKSADKLAGRVVLLNALLVIMTAALVALTIVLAVSS